MNAHTPIAALPPTDAPFDATARARALAERQLQALERMAEVGLEVASAVERKARAPEETESGLQSLAMVYARVARAVRMTVLLQSRVMRELESAERLAAAHAPTLDAQRHAAGEARKASIEKIVSRIATRRGDSAEDIDALTLEASERLDDEALYGDVLTQPMSEVVAHICRDLGLEVDWDALSGEAWAQAEVAASRSPNKHPSSHGRPQAVPGDPSKLSVWPPWLGSPDQVGG